MTHTSALIETLRLALRAQMAPDGHTHDCNHLRVEWPGIQCCGPCQLARHALMQREAEAEVKAEAEE